MCARWISGEPVPSKSPSSLETAVRNGSSYGVNLVPVGNSLFCASKGVGPSISASLKGLKRDVLQGSDAPQSFSTGADEDARPCRGAIACSEILVIVRSCFSGSSVH